MRREGANGQARFPMEGIRVANFGWSWAGPALGHMLADMGAESIKVESRSRPDITRTHGGLFKGEPFNSNYGHNIYRSQYSVTLDLANPEGLDLGRRLAAQSDVVIENFRPGVARRLGLDYETLVRIRPDVVMISLSTAGQYGPLSRVGVYGGGASALAGIQSLQGYDDGVPMPFGTAYMDPYNATVGTLAVLAALHYREETGQGQYIDLSQTESVISTMGAAMLDYTMNGRVHGPLGNHDPNMAPHAVYPCRGDDAWVAIEVESDEQWRALCRAMGRPELAGDRRFADTYRRLRHQEELDALIGEWTAARTPWEVTNALQKSGVAAFPCLRDAEVFTDPHYNERGDWVRLQHRLGPEVIYGIHWKLSETPGEVRSPCPDIGQQNDYILREVLGVPEPDLARLYETRVLY